MNRLLMISASTALLAACSNGGGNNGAAPAATPEPAAPPLANVQFEVSTTNLTVAQPLSPIAVIVHDTSVQMFSIGTPASAGVEEVAEEGATSTLLESIDAAAQGSGNAVVPPGSSDAVTIELPGSDSSGMRLSLITMLVNTNDAFTAINGMDVSQLAIGESVTLAIPAYDAGTEANSEEGEDIPGPAGGGEGFNATRDDIRDQVTMHAGVVTADDGLPGSALGHIHRWDNPVARVTISRVQ